VDDLQQRVAPAVVGGPGVEAAEAFVGGVEHGGEDGVVEGELIVVILRGGAARARAARAGAAARQRGPVPVEDVRCSPRHREPEGLGEQQVLRAGSVQHFNSPSPQKSRRPIGGRRGATLAPSRFRAVTQIMPRGSDILTDGDSSPQGPERGFTTGDPLSSPATGTGDARRTRSRPGCAA
jgi:hypothetical protein